MLRTCLVPRCTKKARHWSGCCSQAHAVEMKLCDHDGNRIVDGKPVKDACYCVTPGCYKKGRQEWHGFCGWTHAEEAGYVDVEESVDAPPGLEEAAGTPAGYPAAAGVCLTSGCDKKARPMWFGFCSFTHAWEAGIVDGNGELVATGPLDDSTGPPGDAAAPRICLKSGCAKQARPSWYGFCSYTHAFEAGHVDVRGDLVATGPPAQLASAAGTPAAGASAGLSVDDSLGPPGDAAATGAPAAGILASAPGAGLLASAPAAGTPRPAAAAAAAAAGAPATRPDLANPAPSVSYYAGAAAAGSSSNSQSLLWGSDWHSGRWE